MNHQERFLRTFHFEPVDHVPDEEFGYWNETFSAWQGQGLPEYVTDNSRADVFFGFAHRIGAPFHVGLRPGFEHAVLEEDDRHVTVRDWDGAIKMVNKDGTSTIPKFIKFALETREDWEKEFKPRLDPTDPNRYPADFEAWKASVQKRDRPLGIGIGSLFGFIRDWMGFENVCYAIHDDPAWIQEMMDHLTNLTLSVIDRPVREVRFDYAGMWEDMCFNHGPILPTPLFAEWMVPRLARITGFLKEHGCDIVIVDCDGNINELVMHWLDAGVNVMFPVEVRGGTDPIKLREKYGHRVLLAGGVDKTKLIDGKDAIKQEIDRLKPLVEDGGYIPHVDHRCPPDVTYENYLFYLRYKRETFGIPEPEPWEIRKEQYEWAK